MRKRIVSFVALLAVVALMLSACSKPATTDNKGGDKPAEAPKEAVLNSAWAYTVPPKSHFNVFTTGTLNFPGGMYTNLMTSPLALYYWNDNSWEKQLATEWTQDDKAQTVTVKLRQGVKWSDGSTFTAKDVLTYSYIGWGKGYTMWRYVDKVTAKDDYTVEFHLGNPTTLALYYILRMNPQPYSVYGKWADQYKAAFDAGKKATDDDVKKLNTDIDAFRPTDYVASGPFKMDVANITEAQVTMTKRADAWNAATVKIDKLVVFNGETEQATPLVLNKTLDYVTHAFPPATEKQFTDMGLRIIRFPYLTGPAIFFNMNVYPFNKVEVRQAIAYAIDRNAAGVVALGNSGPGVKYMSGMADSMTDTWLSKDQISKLNQYSYDTKKAEELLTKVGFKKGADGIWVDDKGKKMEFDLYCPSDFADWMGGATSVAEQLTKFGIKTQVRGPVWDQYTTDMNAGKFQFGLLPWGSSTPHPTFAFQADWINYNAGGRIANPSTDKPGQNWSLKQKYSGGDIDLDTLTFDSVKGMDLNKQKEEVSKLAQAFNELLPIVPLFERRSNAPILDGVNVTGWPKDGDPVLANGSADQFITAWIVTGKLHGVGK
jgi:peptide/nickel transport system substrate-binding protein